MSTITGTVKHSVTIGSGAYSSPLTIAAGATVTIGGTGRAVYSAALATVVDDGAVSAVSGKGIVLDAGGYVGLGGAGMVDASDLGVRMGGTVGTVTNLGLIGAAASVGVGVSLADGGVIDNAGMMTGGHSGAIVSGGAGTVTNSGTLAATASGGTGIYLPRGSIDNTGTAALISGYDAAVSIDGTIGSGAVTNSGTIEATGSSGIGVKLADGGTIVDSGTIGGATAVYLGGTGSNVLRLEAGYSLSGLPIGAAGADNTLELAGGLGDVKVHYNSLGLTNFKFVKFGDPHGHDETLVISDRARLPGTIEGFASFHDIVDLRQLTVDPTGAVISFDSVTDQLTITEGGQSATLQLAGNLSGIVWQAGTDGHGGTDIEPACFARGTLILTENGEYSVEDLSIGDRVMTLAGARRTIKWIGRRSYQGAFLLRDADLWPIAVKAGALGDGVPRRELDLSARHALFLEGVLIPVECLVNGGSIVRCRCPETVEYFHIELDSHDVILAEGAPAETFVDCDDRGIFHNACEFALLYPGREPPRWQFCAPRVVSGRELDRVRRRLRARAGISAVA